MKRLVVPVSTLALAASMLLAACSSGAAPSSPTQGAAPKAAEPTKAPAADSSAKSPSFPQKGRAISLVVPFAAGGGTDVGARLLASTMEKQLGSPVEVVNKTGAGSQVGITELTKAKPDGYTVAATNLPTTNTLYLDPDRKAVFARKDFQPLAVNVLDPGVIVVKNDSPYKSLKDLIDAAKAKPESIKVSTTGIMSGPHLTVLDTQRATGAKFAIVHFEGASQGTTALMGGHIDAQFGYIGDLYTTIKSGQVRPLVVLDAKASRLIPDVPTAESQGFKVTSLNVRGYSAPGGTPKDVVDVLASAVKKAAADEDLKKKMDEMGLDQSFMDAAQFATLWDKMDNDLKPLVQQAKSEQPKQ